MRRGFVLVPICVLFSLLIAACGGSSSSSSSSSSTEPANAEPAAATTAAHNFEGQLKIGAVLPLTGPNASIGEDQRRGVELAVEKVNAAGGVLGKELEVDIEDSEGTAEGTLSAARKLVSVDKVPVVIGEFSSGNTIPLGKYLESQHVVQINSSSSSPEIAEIGEWSFSTLGLDNITGNFVAQTLLDNGYETASFLAPNNSYGQGLYKATRAAFEAAGGTMKESVLYTEGKSDYRAELNRLVGSGAQAYIYTGYGTEIATINREAYEQNLNPEQFFCIYTTLCTSESEPATVENQYGFDNNFIGEGRIPTEYQAAYKKKYGEEFASTFSGYVYDAVSLAAAAIEQAKSAEPAAIRSAIESIGKKGYQGVTGEIKLDAQGQRISQPYLVTKITNGEVEVLAELTQPAKVEGLPGPSH